jgi:beta-xylosidase
MKRLFFSCAVFLLAGLGLYSAAASAAAPKPLYRDPVYDGAADPTLIWDRTGHRWVMFYTNRRASAENLPGVSWVHGTRIGMAESTDGGVTWKYTGTANIHYGKPDYTHWAPEVIWNDGSYHMYLSVVPGIFNDWNAPREIVHLTSQNLKDWQNESKLDLHSDRVIDPCVLRLADGSWRMWFKNERAKDGSIYFADSPDLSHWTAKGVALPGSKGEGPKVFRWKDRYWLVFDAWDGLGVYWSDDCLHWKHQEGNLVKEPGTLATDRTKGNHPDVVVSADGRAYLFYFTHQVGADAEGKSVGWKRHTVIQVAELQLQGGMLTCDRDKPVDIDLVPY